MSSNHVVSFTPKPGHPIRAQDIKQIVNAVNEPAAMNGRENSAAPQNQQAVASLDHTLYPQPEGTKRLNVVSPPFVVLCITDATQEEIFGDDVNVLIPDDMPWVSVAWATTVHEAGGDTTRMVITLDEFSTRNGGPVAISGVAWAVTDGTTGKFATPSTEIRGVLTLSNQPGPAEVLRIRKHATKDQHFAQVRFPALHQSSTGGGSNGDHWRFLPDGE